MSEDELKVIFGQMDAREFAMKNWGWVRVAGKYVQAWILDSKTLRRIANGLFDVFDRDVMNNTFIVCLRKPPSLWWGMNQTLKLNEVE